MIIYVTFIILLLLELSYFKIANHFNVIDKPNERSSHTQATIRGGGIIFYIGVLIWWIYCQFSYPYFFIGLSVISIISFIDDIHSQTPKFRLSIHLFSMLLMIFQLLIAEYNYCGNIYFTIGICFLAIFIGTGALNIFNFMDGINGITGGYSLVVLISLAYIYYQLNNSIINQLILISILAVIVFCFFNFRNKAICFAGDVGSVSIAFILIFILGKHIFMTKDLSWLTLMVVYGVDGVMTILHRIMLHENLSQPHRKHAFQIMANELKIPHVVVSIIYMTLQIITDIFYFIYPGYMSMIICLFILCTSYILFMKKYFHLHMKNSNSY